MAHSDSNLNDFNPESQNLQNVFGEQVPFLRLLRKMTFFFNVLKAYSLI